MSWWEVWQVLRRRWWVAFLVAALAALVAWLYSGLQPTTYQAQAEVVLLPGRADWSLGVYTKERMQTFRAVLLSPPLAEQALGRLGVDLSPADLLGRTYVQIVPDEGRIVIQVQDGDPQRAADLANALAGVFQEWVEKFNRTQIGVDRIYVYLLSPAGRPTAPTGPRTALNTLAGAILGAILGLPLIFVWDQLDDTLRDPQEAAVRLGLPVWRISLSAGDGPPAPLAQPDGEAAAALHRLYALLFFSVKRKTPPGTLWALAAVQPEEIPPHLPAGLGVVVAQGGRSVLLVEGDLERPALHRPFSLEPAGLLSALQQDRPLETLPTAQERLSVLSSAEPLSQSGQALALRRLAERVSDLRAQAGLVLLRLPSPRHVPEALFPLAQSDAVLLVAPAGRVRRREVLAALESLERAAVPLLGLLLWSGRR